jgi:hypothetical protein
MASIRRAGELLTELERLHDTTACTAQPGDLHATGERVSASAMLSP